MKSHTEIPNAGNIYVPSDSDLEKFAITEKIKNEIYGGMEIQVGYCNGKNSTYNGFEFHKGSEINVAVTDFVLVLGHVWDIDFSEKNASFPTYDSKLAQIFFIPANTAVELYQTTLHLSPCRTQDSGFKNIVILPRGTNTPLEQKAKGDFCTAEGKLLLQKNKWVLSHPEREPLIKQRAVPGMLGENKEFFYKAKSEESK